jgi:hypothetical protein
MAHIWEKRKSYRILVGKPEGKRPLGRPKHTLFMRVMFQDLTKSKNSQIDCPPDPKKHFSII